MYVCKWRVCCGRGGDASVQMKVVSNQESKRKGKRQETSANESDLALRLCLIYWRYLASTSHPNRAIARARSLFFSLISISSQVTPSE